MRLEFALRVLEPFAVAVFAGVAIATADGPTAGGIGAYLTLLAAGVAVVLWSRYQLRRSRRRLARLHASRR